PTGRRCRANMNRGADAGRPYHFLTELSGSTHGLHLSDLRRQLYTSNSFAKQWNQRALTASCPSIRHSSYRTYRSKMSDFHSVEGAALRTTFPLHFPDFYAGDPYPAYRELRASAPVCWNDVTGFWALLKYEDIRYASTNPDKFSSTKGITIPDPVMPNPVQEGNLIFTDPPRHRQLRRLINAGFTRRQ